MRLVQGIILFLIFLVALAFAVINADAVTVNYYIGTLQLPLSMVLVIAFALGAVVGLLVGGVRVLALKRELNRLRRSERIAQQELSNLRSLPIRPDH